MTRSFSNTFLLPGRGNAFGTPDVFASGGTVCGLRSMTMVRPGRAGKVRVWPWLKCVSTPASGVTEIHTDSNERPAAAGGLLVQVTSHTDARALSIIGAPVIVGAADGGAAGCMKGHNSSASAVTISI